jgi:mRNA interferase RelE/StbE
MGHPLYRHYFIYGPPAKKLKGGQRDWRIRVGDYRVVYTIDDEKLLVSVMRIRHRSEVYDG